MAYDVFIIYRREGGEHLALRVKEALERKTFSVFMDTALEHGVDLPATLLGEIEKARNILVILTLGCLERCLETGDWLTKEIGHALHHKKRIVPLMDSGFSLPAQECLPESIRGLTQLHGVGLTPGQFQSKIDSLAEGCLIWMLSAVNQTILPSLVWESTGKRWEDLRHCLKAWNSQYPVSSVTMLHISGWAFRNQRLIYQKLNGRSDLPDHWLDAERAFKVYCVGEAVRQEEPADWRARIKIEAGGDEPWPPSLGHLRVFIGNENCFLNWKNTNQEKPMEKLEATRYFWMEYLAKLGRTRPQPFSAELYEMFDPAFYAHVFECESEANPNGGGWIVRLPRRWEQGPWHDEPVAFDLNWPDRLAKPRESGSFMLAVDNIQKSAKKIWPR